MNGNFLFSDCDLLTDVFCPVGFPVFQDGLRPAKLNEYNTFVFDVLAQGVMELSSNFRWCRFRARTFGA